MRFSSCHPLFRLLLVDGARKVPFWRMGATDAQILQCKKNVSRAYAGKEGPEGICAGWSGTSLLANSANGDRCSHIPHSIGSVRLLCAPSHSSDGSPGKVANHTDIRDYISAICETNQLRVLRNNIFSGLVSCVFSNLHLATFKNAHNSYLPTSSHNKKDSWQYFYRSAGRIDKNRNLDRLLFWV